MRALASCSLVLAFAWIALALPLQRADGAVIEGMVLDGAASALRFRELRPTGDEWHVPLANSDLTLHALPGGRTFRLRSDANGGFRLDEFPGDPGAHHFVITAESAGTKLYSASFPADHAHAVFVYPSTDDPGSAEDLQAEVQVAFDLVPVGAGKMLRVRTSIDFLNLDPELYVGSRQGSIHREVFRLPLPQEAQVTVNSGPVSGLEWKRSEDGRWLVIDEPVPGFSDIAHRLREQHPWRWTVSYLTPASQVSAYTFRFPFAVGGMALYAEKTGDPMNIVSASGGLQGPQTMPRDPFEPGVAKAFDAYGVSREGLRAGSELVVALEIDNAVLGEVSSGALRWHGGFLVVTLVAILLGLILGSRRPAERGSLAGLGPDELLDRLVALDRRFEEKKIRERDYRSYRDALVELIALELPEEAGVAGRGVAPASRSPAAPLHSPAIDAIVTRIRALDREGAADPARIAERAHLLEALYKSLDGEGHP